jgi:2-methylisocitrate lyase-like PEP mutase family enzyme
MQRYCREVPGYKMVNNIEQGRTPLLPLPELEAMGYKISVWPLTLLNVSILAMREALHCLREGRAPRTLDFEAIKETVGFSEYYGEEERYR